MSKAAWMPCGSDFVTGDVIRWGEAVWKPKRRQTERGVRIGTRAVIAQVMTCGPEWVELKVMDCITEVEAGWTADNFKRDEVIRRRRSPMARNGAERRLWSDESARSLVASRFRGAPDADAPAGLSGGEARKAHGGASRTRNGKYRRRRKGPRLHPGVR